MWFQNLRAQYLVARNRTAEAARIYREVLRSEPTHVPGVFVVLSINGRVGQPGQRGRRVPSAAWQCRHAGCQCAVAACRGQRRDPRARVEHWPTAGARVQGRQSFRGGGSVRLRRMCPCVKVVAVIVPAADLRSDRSCGGSDKGRARGIRTPGCQGQRDRRHSGTASDGPTSGSAGWVCAAQMTFGWRL